MAWLPHREKISKISLFVLAQLTNVTDGQTDRQTDTACRCPAIAALCIASHGNKINNSYNNKLIIIIIYVQLIIDEY